MSRATSVRCFRRDAKRARGVTLFELLIASVIGLVIILAFMGVDISRIFLTNDANANAGFQTNGAFAINHIARELMGADRIVLLSGSDIQFRRVVGTSLDAAASYDWMQYRYAGDAITYYQQTEVNCSNTYPLAKNISAVDFSFVDESVAPPGGEPGGGEDNNVLQVTVTTQDPVTLNELIMRTAVAIRNGAHTNVATGLAPPGVSDPPSGCT